jgi:hypothetical protein
MDRYDKIQKETGAAIWIVGHTNAAGEHRGNEVLTNNIESTILIDRVREGAGKNAPFIRDQSGRVLRRVTVRKQRQGIDGMTWDFVLQPVELGLDPDGDPITSMVSLPPLTDGSDTSDRPRRAPFNRDERMFRQLLQEAIAEHGVLPPSILNLSASAGFAITWDDFRGFYDSRVLPADGDADDKKHRERRKAAGNSLKLRRVIGVRGIDGRTWLWIIKSDTGG